MRKGKAARRTTASAIAVLAVCALYNGLTIRQYPLKSSKIKEPVTLVLISDLHNSLFGDGQENLTGLIKKQKPDLILVTGDIVNSARRTENAELFLKKAKDICPVYYVTGNHEYGSYHIGTIRKMVEDSGAIILSDTSEAVEVKGNRIIVAGIDDPDKRYCEDKSYSQKESMQKAFGSLPDMEEYKILLAHRPEMVGSYLPYGFDLILSGHAHGGQVRVPFLLNGLYSPDQGFFPKLAGGRYSFGGTTMIVSRGASFYWRLPRVFNPPEVVVINLSGK